MSLLASPPIADLLAQFSALLRNGRLDRPSRELVALVAARAWNCEHLWRAHETRALAAGVPLDLVEAIRLNRELRPCNDDGPLHRLARFALLLQQRTRVPDDLFEAVREQLGEARFPEVIALCALEGSMALLLNASADREALAPGPRTG